MDTNYMKWLKHESKFLIDNYKKLKIKDIALYLNRSRLSVSTHVSMLGLADKRHYWSKGEINQLKQMYGKYCTIDIAKKLNLTTNMVQNKIKLLKLTNNKQKSWKSKSIANKKYSISESFFQKHINAPYWAGFIAADGNINQKEDKLSITLHNKDLKLLQQFKEEINYTGPIRVHRKDYIRLDISSKQICLDLKNIYNIIPAKSLILQPPNLNHFNSLKFIKGYIDGDGHISYCKSKKSIQLGIIGTYNMMIWIKNILEQLLPRLNINNKVIKRGTIYGYFLAGKTAIQIIQFLKRISTPYLDRKWIYNVTNQ